MNLRKTGILLAWAMIIAANGTAQNVQRTSQGIKYAAQGMNVSVEFYSPSIIRVYKTPGETKLPTKKASLSSKHRNKPRFPSVKTGKM